MAGNRHRGFAAFLDARGLSDHGTELQEHREILVISTVKLPPKP